MTTKIQKWGNSLAIRIPQHIAQKHNLVEGSPVLMEEMGESIKIKPISKAHLSLKELLRNVNPDNIHKETNWGSPMGKEIW